jgi:membrane-associated protease RseP (regulator of RpoE activity)
MAYEEWTVDISNVPTKKEPVWKNRKFQRHTLLFLATLASTFLVGLSYGSIGQAVLYAVALMGILLTHEMGHYLMARKHRVPASLPYFIPIPFGPFGTLGAVIKMENRMPNRRVLLDIGLAGPLAGMAVILPVTLIGFFLSEVQEVGAIQEGALPLGNSLMVSLMTWITHGSLGEGVDLMLHPLAYAGWVGLLVTSINLLPIGQLDGGHVVYALFGRRSKVPAAMFYMGFLAVFLFLYMGWILLIILLAVFRRHPPTLNDHLPLDRKRRILGYLAFLVFLLTFTPVPFGIGEGFIPFVLKGFSY